MRRLFSAALLAVSLIGCTPDDPVEDFTDTGVGCIDDCLDLEKEEESLSKKQTAS